MLPTNDCATRSKHLDLFCRIVPCLRSLSFADSMSTHDPHHEQVLTSPGGILIVVLVECAAKMSPINTVLASRYISHDISRGRRY